MSHAGRQFRVARGFTLLELLVAVAMVAVIALALSACLHIAFSATDRAHAAIQPSHDAELAMEFLRNDFQNACIPSPPFLGSYVPFQGVNQMGSHGGEADDVLFFSTADARDHTVANGEIKLIELTTEVAAGSTDTVLVRRVTRNLLSPNSSPTVDEEILCRGVAGFSVNYFDGSSWYNSWGTTDSATPTPVAVQVTLTLNRAAGSPQAQPFQFVRVFNLACTPPSNDVLNMGGL